MDGGIKFDVSATTAKFDADMARVGNSANTAASKIKNAFSGIGGLLVGGAMVAGLNKLLNQFGRIDDLAIRFGTNAESIQRVGHAAQLAGTDIEAVANAMTKAGIAATTAAREGGKAAETFGRAGINARSFADADLAQKVVMIAEAYAKAGGNADKTAAIIEIMGARAGANLIPLISNLEELRERMSGVAVASSEMTKRLAEAGDMLDKWKNQLTIAAVGGIQVFTDSMERLGSLLGGAGFKTIAELEEIEARASAIAQLTNEGAFGFDAVRNAELIAERTAQILEQTRGTAQQIQIAEDSTDRVLGLEKEKTAELDRQQAALEGQEEQRQRSIRSIEQEIRLMEAQLSGNKELEESLRQQADFDAVMEKTGNFETAANFAATKAAERQAQLAALSGESSAGGGGGGGRSFSPRDNDPTQNQIVAEMRADAARNRRMGRFDELLENRQFQSAARLQQSAERAANQILRNQERRDALRDAFGADNAGEAVRNLERDAFKAGMTFDEALSRMGIGRKVGEDRADALERFVKEQAKPEAERIADALARGEDPGEDGGGGGSGASLDDILNLLKKHMPSMDEKLPQHALVPG